MPSEVNRTCRIQVLETRLKTVFRRTFSPSPFSSVMYGFCLHSPASLREVSVNILWARKLESGPVDVCVDNEAGGV